jgi:hypothetical protein
MTFSEKNIFERVTPYNSPYEAAEEREERLPLISNDTHETSVKENKNGTTVTYGWKNSEETGGLRIRRMTFRKGEDLAGITRLNAKDGDDRAVFEHRGVTYFIRKTNEDVALALFNAAAMIKGGVESIVGYLTTVLGNFYVISLIERGSWVFDRKLVSGKVSLIKKSKLDRKHRERLSEMVVSGFASLHNQRLVLGKFSLNNILLTGKGLLFTDLRKLRVSRKSSLLVDEFVEAMRQLVAGNMAGRGDVAYAAAAYAVEMEDACNCWYRERNGGRAKDGMELVNAMEQEIYS